MNPSVLFNFSSLKVNGRRQGYVLFYVIGLLTLLGFYASMSLASLARESRAARNYVSETRALYHAEAGARLVKPLVENRLESGMDLETALSGLTVPAPAGYDFDTISTFEILVPEKLFRFVSIGRSGDAEAELEVQYRVGDPLLESGVFGSLNMSTDPNVTIYGYDSRRTPNPTSADSNGRAAVGGNVVLSFGNSFSVDGTINRGSSSDGTLASLSNPTGQRVVESGHIDPDPMGANGGELEATVARVSSSNNNSSVPQISGTVMAAKPGDTITFTSGDYYFTDLYTPPNCTVVIDDSSGPVRFYVDGEVSFQPNTFTQGADPYNFQIYSISDEDITVKPNSQMSAFIYAPNAEVELKPNGNFLGGIWGGQIILQPNTNMYLDTSLQDRFPSDDLSVHAWIERR
jgi:hypothetical protein